jgi:hypothetical protein
MKHRLSLSLVRIAFTRPAEQPIAVRVFRDGPALDVRVDLH